MTAMTQLKLTTGIKPTAARADATTDDLQLETSDDVLIALVRVDHGEFKQVVEDGLAKSVERSLGTDMTFLV